MRAHLVVFDLARLSVPLLLLTSHWLLMWMPFACMTICLPCGKHAPDRIRLDHANLIKSSILVACKMLAIPAAQRHFLQDHRDTWCKHIGLRDNVHVRMERLPDLYAKRP